MNRNLIYGRGTIQSCGYQIKHRKGPKVGTFQKHKICHSYWFVATINLSCEMENVKLLSWNQSGRSQNQQGHYKASRGWSEETTMVMCTCKESRKTGEFKSWRSVDKGEEGQDKVDHQDQGDLQDKVGTWSAMGCKGKIPKRLSELEELPGGKGYPWESRSPKGLRWQKVSKVSINLSLKLWTILNRYHYQNNKYNQYLVQ